MDFRFRALVRARERAAGRPRRDPNLDMRLRFVTGDIDEKRLATTLLKRDNRVAVLIGEVQVFDLVATIVSEALRAIAASPRNTIYELARFLVHVGAVVRFANTQLLDVSRTFNRCKVRQFQCRLGDVEGGGGTDGGGLYHGYNTFRIHQTASAGTVR